MLRGIVLFFALLVALRFLWIIHSVLIVTFVAILLAVVITPVVDRLERHRIRRGIGAMLVVVGVLALLGGAGALMAPTLRDQTHDLRQRIPEAIDKIEQWMNKPAVRSLMPAGTQPGATGQTSPSQQGQPQPAAAQQQPNGQPQPGAGSQQGGAKAAAQSKPGDREPAGKPAQQEGGGSSLRNLVSKQLGGIVGYLFPFVSSAVAALGGILIVLVLAIYIASDPRLYRIGVLHLVPHAQRARARDVMRETGEALRQWMVARLLAMLAVGIITALAMLVLGVKAWIALGVIAGLLEFIPFFGPILSAIPAIAVGLVDSPQKALFVGIAFLIIQQIEGNVITPLLLKNRIDVPPALTIVSVSALGIVFGFLGLLIAEPLLVATLVFVKMLYVNDMVGDDV